MLTEVRAEIIVLYTKKIGCKTIAKTLNAPTVEYLLYKRLQSHCMYDISIWRDNLIYDRPVCFWDAQLVKLPTGQLKG